MSIEILGYFASFGVGLVLGILGGGGAILTIPIMVYMFNVPKVIATSYSLFVVGVSSLFGTVTYFRKKKVNIKTALIFALPSFITIYLTRKYVLNIIPESLFTWGDFTLTKDTGIMILLAIIMLAAAVFMITDIKSITAKSKTVKFLYWIIVLEGALIGILTGITGIGGGFIIVPALTLLVKLPIRVAVGTSLFIICMKAAIGFVGDIQAERLIDWNFLLTFTGISIAGILVGSSVSKFFPEKRLKKMFGWFILLMAVFVFYKELIP